MEREDEATGRSRRLHNEEFHNLHSTSNNIGESTCRRLAIHVAWIRVDLRITGVLDSVHRPEF
jgi:hypothetical protein